MQFLTFLLRVAPWLAGLWIYRALQQQQQLERDLSQERLDHLQMQLTAERARREQAELMVREAMQAPGGELAAASTTAVSEPPPAPAAAPPLAAPTVAPPVAPVPPPRRATARCAPRALGGRCRRSLGGPVRRG